MSEETWEGPERRESEASKGRRKQDLERSLTDDEFEVIHKLPRQQAETRGAVTSLSHTVTELTATVKEIAEQLGTSQRLHEETRAAVRQTADEIRGEVQQTRGALEEVVPHVAEATQATAERILNTMSATGQQGNPRVRDRAKEAPKGAEPTEDEVRQEERSQRAQARAAAENVKEGGKSLLGKAWSAVKFVAIPESKEDVAKMTTSFSVGFFAGGRVARSDWLDRQAEDVA